MSYELIKSRYDVTDWVVHFTRNHNGLGAIANFVNIIRDGALIPSWSLRGGNRTIYGPHPAVCFTEQPLWAFLQYVEQRNNPSSVSGYAVAIHKHDLYAEGGLPVVYGLGNRSRTEAVGEVCESGVRLLDPAVLAEEEQYRFVHYNPSPLCRNPIDWTHEREWRWSGKSSNWGKYLLGMPVVFSSERKPSKARYALIVERDEDIQKIQGTILGLEDEVATEPYIKAWYRKLKTAPRIISLETVKREVSAGHFEYGKVDTFPFNDGA